MITERFTSRRALLCVAGLVVVSAIVRAALAEHVAAPWIMVDELIYSELAKSFAAHGSFEVRGVAATGYGLVYPILVAPAWLLHAVPAAYDVAKAINAVVMSLAAIPAYLLGRRLLARPGALAAAVLAVLVPSMLYTGTLMTENAFYPLFLTATLLVVANLERPTLLRQIVLLAVLVVTYETRQQGIVLFAAAGLAPIVHGLLDRRLVERVRGWLPFYYLAAAAALLVVIVYELQGRSPLAVLGPYRIVATGAYSWPTAARFALWHLAELDLYVGVAPLAAFLLLVLRARARPELRAFVAATVPIAVLLVLEVALFASRYSDRIEERYLFYLAPFTFVALVWAVERPAAVVTPATGVALVVAAALPAAIPFARFVNASATPDTFALLPWWSLHDHGVAFGSMRWLAAAGAVAAVLLLFAPRRLRALPVLAVGAYLLGTSAIAYGGRHGVLDASHGTLRAGIHGKTRDWVDRVAGRQADVALLWDGTAPIQSVWENEIFNRSVGAVVTTGSPYPDGLPVVRLHERRDGELVTAADRPYTTGFALVPPSVALVGTVVARDTDRGLQLVRVDGPLKSISTVRGLYPGDVWSGRSVTYTRRDCAGGAVDVALASDPALYSRNQVVTASESGRQVARVAVAPAATAHLHVPLRALPNGSCIVHFRTAEVRVPAQVEPGSSDTRRLGARFLSFAYTG